LERDGFQVYNETVTVRAGRESRISPVLDPVAQYGTLDISSNPDRCKVFINNTYYEKTPFKVRLSAGQHTIKLQKRGFHTLVKTVSIKGGQTKHKDFNLKRQKPVRKRGRLQITSYPDDADISIQNQFYGKTPMEIGLDQGNYDLKITKKGYRPYRIEVTVRRGETNHVDASLKKRRPTHKFGTLHLTAVPRKAKVMVDGEFRGKTPLSLRLPAGKHRVRIRRRGFAPYREKVRIRAGEEHYIDANLARSGYQPPPMEGALDIVSKPLKSKVFINGQYFGKTPLKITMTPDTYNVEIRHRGYSTYRKVVRVDPGTEKRIRAHMRWKGHGPPSPHEIMEELAGQIFK
jgi:hypothetical protein